MKLVCPVCSSENLIFLDEQMFIHKCKVCTHEFADLSKITEEKYSEEYFSSMHKNWFLNPNYPLFNRIAELISHGARSGAKILDVGCGRGDLLRYLHSKLPNYNLNGFDLTPNQDEGINYFQGDFDNYQFFEKFGVVSSLMVVEHSRDPKIFAQRLKSIIEPNALVIIVTINSDGFLYRLAKIFKNFGIRFVFERLYEKHHLQHFNNKSLKRVFFDAGFDFVELKNHNFPIKAVDFPKMNIIFKIIYLFLLSAVFKTTSVIGGGMNQTMVIKNTKLHERKIEKN